MGLFGEVDAADVPDDPFHVDNGTYLTVLTELKFLQRNSDGQHGVSAKFAITEDDSPFAGNTVQAWKNYYPEATEDELAENNDMRKDLARLKQFLLSLGVPESDMDKFEAVADEYVGNEYYVTVKNTEDQKDPSKKYRNITHIRTPEE